jgi:hypothetical protein
MNMKSPTIGRIRKQEKKFLKLEKSELGRLTDRYLNQEYLNERFD